MNTKEPDWNLYRSFLAVLEEGSLSGAARALGLTQPTMARHIEALEQAVGFELFTRSQQGLAATEGALELKPHAQSLAATAAALLRSASGQGGTVKGTVRVSASEIMGAEVLPAIFSDLAERHPGLEIELVLSNAIENLLRRDADIAVRMVAPIQEALVMQHVGTVTLGLYAHRRYLERRGVPRHLNSLRDHQMIGVDHETPAVRAMLMQVPDLEALRFSFRTDNDVAYLMAIKAGLGVGICQVALARRDPDLQRVLAASFDLKLGVWIAMHENLRSTPRCRIVFDALVAGLRSHVD
jgi:DNA-binding transcriptional LysR family regulator